MFFFILILLVKVHVPKHIRGYEKSLTKNLVYEFILSKLI